MNEFTAIDIVQFILLLITSGLLTFLWVGRMNTGLPCEWPSRKDDE